MLKPNPASTKVEKVVGYDLGDVNGIPVHRNKFDVLDNNPFE